MVLASYGIDALLLGGFAATGTLPVGVPLAYAGCGLLHGLLFGGALRLGIGARIGDISLGLWQSLFASAVQLLFLWHAPVAATLFISVLFITFIFGAFALNSRQTVLLMAAIALGVLAVTFSGVSFGPLIEPTPAGRLLGALTLISALARCLVLGLWATALRAKLDARNGQLAGAMAELDRLATTDHLTGIMNRRSLMAAIGSLTDQRAQPHHQHCVAMLDLDHFKAINDQFGHLVGDAVLKQFAQIVKGHLREADAVGRYGGEEFLVILRHTDAQEAPHALDRMRAAVADFDWNPVGAGLRVTVSIGAARQCEGDSLDVLLSRADSALYDAKRAGRNRVEFCA